MQQVKSAIRNKFGTNNNYTGQHYPINVYKIINT